MSVELENHVIDLLPAFVLDALTDEETNQVAEHLAVCQTCQVELSRLQLVADDLPLALMQTAPPPRVKDSLMASIHSRSSASAASPEPSTWQKLVGLFRMPLPAVGLALIVIMAVGNLFLCAPADPDRSTIQYINAGNCSSKYQRCTRCYGYYDHGSKG